MRKGLWRALNAGGQWSAISIVMHCNEKTC